MRTNESRTQRIVLFTYNTEASTQTESKKCKQLTTYRLAPNTYDFQGGLTTICPISLVRSVANNEYRKPARDLCSSFQRQQTYDGRSGILRNDGVEHVLPFYLSASVLESCPDRMICVKLRTDFCQQVLYAVEL